MIRLTRRELERAERSSPLVHARILEALPPLSPDLSDRISAPDCREELAHESEAALRKRPLVYSRLLVMRVRLTPDAETLLGLAARGDNDFTDYRLAPGEPGPPPPRSLIRYLALGNIPVQAVMFNVPEGKRLLTERVRASTDDREQLLLSSAARLLLSESLQSKPERDHARLSLLHTGLPDLRRRLMGPPDRVSLELVLRRLADVGTLGTRLDVGNEARALVSEILAAKGEFPATRGVAGAARDLAEVARGALHDLDVPVGSPEHGFGLPPPRRTPFDPGADWLDREPAGGQASEAEALARVRELEGELGTLSTYRPRCYVLKELARWMPGDEASRRFDALVAPIFDGDRIRLSTETLCRMGVALELDGVGEPRRIELLRTLLSVQPGQVGARDMSGDESGMMLLDETSEQPVRTLAARALAQHLDWIDHDADVRTWLEAEALAPIPLAFGPAEAWSVLQPAFDRLVDLHLAGGPGSSMETARTILRAWMQAIRTAEAAKGVSHIYVGEVVRARIRSLGDRGRRAGLVEEVEAFLGARKKDRPTVIASFMLTL